MNVQMLRIVLKNYARDVHSFNADESVINRLVEKIDGEINTSAWETADVEEYTNSMERPESFLPVRDEWDDREAGIQELILAPCEQTTEDMIFESRRLVQSIQIREAMIPVIRAQVEERIEARLLSLVVNV